jgi:hypothetical protein
LLSKYENFTLEWREKFEESVSFGKARGGSIEGFWSYATIKFHL